MSPKLFMGGSIKDNAWSVHVTDEYKSKVFAGYQLRESLVSALVDAGVETIVFIDPNRGRYVSEVDDWYEFGMWDDNTGWVSLRQSWMERA